MDEIKDTEEEEGLVRIAALTADMPRKEALKEFRRCNNYASTMQNNLAGRRALGYATCGRQNNAYSS
jgi:hypothetical protein